MSDRYISVVINTAVTGMHAWPGGYPHFLQSSHRHRFTVRAEISVSHVDRSIEIILTEEVILDYFRKTYKRADEVGTDLDFGSRSCEMIADELVSYLETWRQGTAFADSRITVEVLEDGLLGGKVSNTI